MTRFAPSFSRLLLSLGTLLFAAVFTLPHAAQAQQTAFTYQAQLQQSGSPVDGTKDLQFTLYDSKTGGSTVGSAVVKQDVTVSNGVLTTSLDFGAVFAGGPRFIEVGVRDGGSTGSFTTLSPRTALRPAPLAMALPNVTVDTDGKVGVATASPASPLTVNGTIESTSGGVKLPDGTLIQGSGDLGGGGGGSGWSLSGNSGTTPGTDFLGTTDDTALELKVNGEPALRLQPAGTNTPNVIGGNALNGVPSGVVGATISGGGFNAPIAVTEPNQITASWGTVSGGRDNRVSGNTGVVGGGRSNRASGDSSTVAGGSRNEASGTSATVAGGENNTVEDVHDTVAGGSENVASGGGAAVSGDSSNTASNLNATVGGGNSNTASGDRSTISGGDRNTASDRFSFIGGGAGNSASGNTSTVGGGVINVASGESATVPGGSDNEAGGKYSFAAGRRAKANHDGTFVWGDNHGSDFASTATDQFLVRAEGGFGLGTNDPAVQLHVQESVKESGASNLGRHAAAVENTSSESGADVLGLKSQLNDPGGITNFISFLDADEQVGTIQGNGAGGIEITGTGADYAEELPVAEGGSTPEPTDLVGVRGGKISLETEGVDRVMIASEAPMMTGNATPATTADDARRVAVAFVGQVAVRLTGTANVGDLIVASGQDDGTARAVAPGAYRPDTHGSIAGRAWSEKLSPGAGTVTVAVGLDQSGALVEQLQRQRSRIQEQNTRLQSLEQRVRRLESLLEAQAASSGK